MLKMKKLISFALVTLMLFALMPLSAFAASAEWDGSIANGFASGSGTASDPYIIKTPSQLAFFAKQVNNGASDFYGQYIKLGANIILNDTTDTDWSTGLYYFWDPIGYPFQDGDTTRMYCFKGTFDGNGKYIRGVVFQNDTRNDAGLFGDLHGATIKNLTVIGSYIEGVNNVGGISGYSQYSTFENCKVLESEIYGAENVGGITGVGIKGSISDSSTDSDVYGYIAAGGIVGYMYGYESEHAKISNCRSNGLVTTAVNDDTKETEYSGGIVGFTANIDISNCINNATVNSNEKSGGIAGYAEYANITDCKNNGDIYSPKYAGGLVASSYKCEYSNCQNNGEVSATDYAGGIVSNAFEDTVKNCENNGIVYANKYSGGISGYAYLTIIEGGTNTASVVGYNNVGGIVGDGTESSISLCKNLGTVGYSNAGDRLNSKYLGGIAGSIANNGYIENCYNAGNIYGGNYVGGIVGYIYYSGNLVEYATISMTYSVGNIVSDLSEGGIIGAATDVALYSECYYLNSSAAIGQGVVVTDTGEFTDGYTFPTLFALSEAEMREKASYQYFDFDKIWTINPNAEYPYPTFVADSYMLGDIDGDNDVDADDYILLKRIYFGQANLEKLKNPSTASLRSDVNKDGDIDADDYILLKRVYFGQAKLSS